MNHHLTYHSSQAHIDDLVRQARQRSTVQRHPDRRARRRSRLGSISGRQSASPSAPAAETSVAFALRRLFLRGTAPDARS